jgi:hypothetical protein
VEIGEAAGKVGGARINKNLTVCLGQKHMCRRGEGRGQQESNLIPHSNEECSVTRLPRDARQAMHIYSYILPNQCILDEANSSE